jgi:hypothetical protein
MASLDSLPADQRAVLQLVLQRGKSYDEIAALLSIDRAAVRERALNALDALGPQTGVPPERRALITDYLLGQLPPRVTEDVRAGLAASAGERAWARVVASELAPIASKPLPEIPLESAARPPEPHPAAPAASEQPAPTPAAAPADGAGEPEPSPARPSSRRGGAVLLGGVVVVAVVVLVFAVNALTRGSSSKKSSTSSTATASAPAATTISSPTTTSAAQVTAQVNLSSPIAGQKTVGVAFVVRQGTNEGLVLRATGVPANTTHNAYAVWLYNSPTDSHILGFVSPGVKADGRLQTAGVLPSNAAHFKQLLVTLETQAKPHGPGKIVLEGPLNLTQ